MGLELEDYRKEGLEGLGVPHRMGVDLELEDYMQEGIEVGFEVHHMMGRDLVQVDCRKVGLGVVVPRKLEPDRGQALQML